MHNQVEKTSGLFRILQGNFRGKGTKCIILGAHGLDSQHLHLQEKKIGDYHDEMTAFEKSLLYNIQPNSLIIIHGVSSEKLNQNKND